MTQLIGPARTARERELLFEVEKAERERDEALALLREIDDGVYGAMPDVLNERLAKLLKQEPDTP
jgi:hypothetical protein